MTSRQTRTGHRGATAAVLVVGGGTLAAATWLGGQHGLALALVGFLCPGLGRGLSLGRWSGRRRRHHAHRGDERQRGLDRDANSITGVVLAAAVIGAVVETAQHGDPGPYGLMCVVAGLTYTVSLVVLRRRR